VLASLDVRLRDLDQNYPRASELRVRHLLRDLNTLSMLSLDALAGSFLHVVVEPLRVIVGHDFHDLPFVSTSTKFETMFA